MTVFKGSVWIRRRNMLRCCLPETTTTTAKFDVYFVVTGSVTPASCCFSSSPTGLEDEAQSSAHSKLVLTTVTLFWSLSTSGTGLGPSLQVFCSRGVPRRRKIRGTHTRAHTHTHRAQCLAVAAGRGQEENFSRRFRGQRKEKE